MENGDLPMEDKFNGVLLKMNIETADLPIDSMVDLSIVFCIFTKE